MASRDSGGQPRGSVSTLELALFLVLVAVLGASLLSRFGQLDAGAERRAVEQLLGELRERIRYGQVIMLNDRQPMRLEDLADGNPLELFAPATAGAPWREPESVADRGAAGLLPVALAAYAGEFPVIDEALSAPVLKKGQWGFDKASATLVYRAANPAAFGLAEDSAGLLRYRLVAAGAPGEQPTLRLNRVDGSP